MSEHVFRLRRADLEFEVRGDREFVEEQLDRWAAAAFGNAGTVEGPAGEEPQSQPGAKDHPDLGVPPGAESGLARASVSGPGDSPFRPQATPEFWTPGVPVPRMPGAPMAMRVRKNISFADFLALKEPKTSLDRLLTLAYYLEKYEGQNHYGMPELDRSWADAFPDDAFSTELCLEAVRSGYVEEVDGHLTLSFSGEAYVQNGLADRFR